MGLSSSRGSGDFCGVLSADSPAIDVGIPLRAHMRGWERSISRASLHQRKVTVERIVRLEYLKYKEQHAMILRKIRPDQLDMRLARDDTVRATFCNFST